MEGRRISGAGMRDTGLKKCPIRVLSVSYGAIGHLHLSYACPAPVLSPVGRPVLSSPLALLFCLKRTCRVLHTLARLNGWVERSGGQWRHHRRVQRSHPAHRLSPGGLWSMRQLAAGRLPHAHQSCKDCADKLPCWCACDPTLLAGALHDARTWLS